MRHFTLAAAGLALATMFAMTPAMAEMGGPVVQNGQCRQFNGNSNNLDFYYWGACPSTEPRRGGVGVRTVRVTVHHKKGT